MQKTKSRRRRTSHSPAAPICHSAVRTPIWEATTGCKGPLIMAAAENLLRSEPSPYLLQHANNPVHWRPWGPEALAEARASNRPILLSIGYAACHWCHVMAHESFEDRKPPP